MKRKMLAFMLMLVTALSLTACGNSTPPPSTPEEVAPTTEVAPPATTPASTEAEAEVEADSPAAIPDTFLWDNFENRDPNSKPDLAPNGMSIWWDNWANLRAGNDNNIMQIKFRPQAFDPEDFLDEADYYAKVGDWMGNWGEAIDMWGLDNIQWCKYLTIRMSGEEGNEENKLILHFQPEDGPVFAKRFSDLVTKDGQSPQITTDMQDIVIDLEASGFPGMTNRMHIRAFAECTVSLDEIYFSGPIEAIHAESQESILSSITATPIEGLSALPIKSYVDALKDITLFDNFDGRDPNNKPELAPNGLNIWWDNWANLRASNEDGVIKIDFRPNAFDPEDYIDEADYYAKVGDWMGNWGEAIDMWSMDNIQWNQYCVIRVGGAEGGEENKLILHFQPEDGPIFAKRFSDLVTQDGSNPTITEEMQDIVIDLEASGFPGMTNRMHIRAFAGCTIFLDEIYFSDSVGPVNTESQEGILSGITATPIGALSELPIQSFIAELQ